MPALDRQSSGAKPPGYETLALDRRYEVGRAMELAPIQERPQKRARGRAGHLWHALRRAAPTRKSEPKGALGRAARPFFPWHVVEYPGLLAGLGQLYGARASLHTIRDWIRGKRKPPAWAWHLIAAEADRRIAALEHVRELAKKEANPTAPP